MDQVSNADQMRARGYAQNGRRDYNRWLAARSVSSPFERIITYLLRVRSAASILDELGQRCTWQAIAHWRSGRRRPPQWVLDRLAEVLRADLAKQLALLAEVEVQPAPGQQHPGSQAALRRVNAARKTGRRMGEPIPGHGEASKTKEAGD